MRPDLETLEAIAQALYDAGKGMDEIMQFLLDRESPIWFDAAGARLPGLEVVKLPTYQRIKALARKRGIEKGLLSATAPSLGLPFEAYLHTPTAEKN